MYYESIFSREIDLIVTIYTLLLIKVGLNLDEVPWAQHLRNIVQLLLEHGADPNAKNDQGASPLYLAVQSDHYETAKLLIEHKADTNLHSGEHLNVPIHFAIDFENMKILKLLIENGASINFKGSDGFTALMFVVYYEKIKNEEIVRFLLEHGADPNVMGTNDNRIDSSAKCMQWVILHSSSIIWFVWNR